MIAVIDDARVDATAKVTGMARYVADVSLAGTAHAAFVRSTEPHARIVRIDTDAAHAVDGVLGVFTAADVTATPYGRGVADCPVLAREKVRFVGERVAAVVAVTRRQAEAAAELVDVVYEPLPAVLTPAAAMMPAAPAVHDRPWAYHGAVTEAGAPPNVVYHATHGSSADVETALRGAAYTVDRTYVAHSTHQGYLEPQACLADWRSPIDVRVWLTAKAPYRIREILARCLSLDASAIRLEPVTLGGDFGGKGSPQDAPVCIELSRLTGRPVRSVLRYHEDLTATNPRHPAEIRVRIGCDADGRIVAASVQAVLNAGAYAGFTPRGTGPHGAGELNTYRIPVFASEVTRVYTNTVPRGNMRAPGGPQSTFAVESAVDELAGVAGIDPVELRRRNLLHTGEQDAAGRRWVEHRGGETLDAAVRAIRRIEPPPGWRHGTGVAVYSRATATKVNTSLRLVPLSDGGLRVEVPVIETGTGSHTALHRMLSDRLGFDRARLEIVGVDTGELPDDAGAGGSRVTAGLATAVDAAAKAWAGRTGREPVTVIVREDIEPHVGSYTVQVAQVAVDPETGELRVLELLTAVDVAAVVNPRAHQMQIDGGVAMGVGYACTEDLAESDGQVWSANLGEFRPPTTVDMPRLRTVYVPGGVGVGSANVKNIGESTTPPVAAAIANAVYAATGCRLRQLPLTAERIHAALRGAT
jgi:CO/xanthine dehydrogenase Mo-binding subunit